MIRSLNSTFFFFNLVYIIIFIFDVITLIAAVSNRSAGRNLIIFDQSGPFSSCMMVHVKNILWEMLIIRTLYVCQILMEIEDHEALIYLGEISSQKSWVFLRNVMDITRIFLSVLSVVFYSRA